MPPSTIPLSTYRLQFNAGFTFDDATRHRRLSRRARHLALLRLELLQGGARQHARLRRRRSDAAQPRDRRRRARYGAWVDALRAHGMGHIIDLVPNHMGIAQVGQPVVAGRARERRRARATPTSSTSTGIRSSRSSSTRCCCRSSATRTARCSSGRRSQLEYERRRVPRRATSSTCFPIAPGTYDRILGARRRMRCSTRSAQTSDDGDRVPQHPDRDPPPAGRRRRATPSCAPSATARRRSSSAGWRR